jgi:hypothetical protein
MAVAVLLATYSPRPGRINAAFLTIGTLPQVLLAYLLPSSIVPRYGAEAGFVILCGAGVFCAVLGLVIGQPLVPDPVPQQSGKIGRSTLVVLSLMAALLSTAAIGSCWSYAERIATETGLTDAQTGLAIAVSLAFQVLGSLLVALVGWRLPYIPVLVIGALAQVGCMILLLASHGSVTTIVGLSLFGFLWQGCFPFGMDLLVSVDESRASAPLIMPLAFVGLSVGPLIASFFVGTTVRGALYCSAWAFAGTALLYLAVHQLMRYRATRPLEGVT